MTQEIKNFLKKYSTSLKWGLATCSIFLMIMAIQIYVNYTTIIENTEIVILQKQQAQAGIDYINNYQLKYLDSDHAKKLLAHENNILKQNEIVISFTGKKEEKSHEIIEEKRKETPRGEWKNFFHKKLEKIQI